MRYSKGFTLLELLVALSIFSLIAAAGYSGLSSLSKALQLQQDNSRELAQIQWLVARLDQDISQAINRSSRAGNNFVPALLGDNRSLKLVSLSSEVAIYQAISAERPVSWQWQNQQIQRQLWQLPDQVSGTPPLVNEILLDNVLEFEFRYLDDNSQWQLQWNSQARNKLLPRAIEYQLQTENFGQIRRIIELPGPRR